MTQPCAFMSAFDQAWNICQHYCCFIIDLGNAEVGFQSREGIVADLGFGVRQNGEEGRFPGVG